MDFHSLSRRELQALCKMNKIPANITNIAMADALQALETVEGLEEMLIQSAAGYLETPAKSMTAARSVSRTSNKQSVLQEEPENSKLTTRARRGTRKGEAETDAAAPPSACPKFPMAAHSTQRNVESSTAAYTTRRSTRLLEKQMCQLSLNDNADIVDTNANKDSQDLQRQFSQDMDNSLAPDTKTVSDESNVTEEAAKETNVLKDACSEVVEFKNDEGQPMQEDVEDSCNEIVVDSSTNEKSTLSSEQPMQEDVAEKMDTASHYESSSEDEFEAQDNFNCFNDTEEATQLELITVDVMEETIGSEANSNADDDNSTDDDSAVDSDDAKQVDLQIKLGLSSALIADKGEEVEAEQKMDTFKMKALEVADDEFDFLSESDGEIDDVEEEVDQLVEEDVQYKNENPCPVDDMVPESVFAGVETAIPSDDIVSESAAEATEKMVSKSPLMARDQIVEGTLESSSKNSASVSRGSITDNKENFQMMSVTKPLLALQAVTAPRAAGTPIEKKSLRQLKKMVKGLYKAEEMQPAPLQVRTDNV